jgi:hypothetical protein
MEQAEGVRTAAGFRHEVSGLPHRAAMALRSTDAAPCQQLTIFLASWALQPAPGADPWGSHPGNPAR